MKMKLNAGRTDERTFKLDGMALLLLFLTQPLFNEVFLCLPLLPFLQTVNDVSQFCYT